MVKDGGGHVIGETLEPVSKPLVVSGFSRTFAGFETICSKSRARVTASRYSRIGAIGPSPKYRRP